MSWWLIVALAGTAYGFKAFGLLVVGGRSMPPALDRCLALIPVAMLAALVVKDTFGVGQSLQLDARAAGIGVAIVAAWRRAPLILVIVLAAAVTALLRTL